jgi:hypothetical protein
MSLNPLNICHLRGTVKGRCVSQWPEVCSYSQWSAHSVRPQTRDHCTSLNLSVGSVLEDGLGWGSESLNISSRIDFYHLVS